MGSPKPLALMAGALGLSAGAAVMKEEASGALATVPKPGKPGHLPDLDPDLPILYAVSTGEVYHQTRAVTVYNTWCKGSKSCVFYSDAENEGRKPQTIKVPIEGVDHYGVDGIHLAQLRYMRILRHATKMVLSNRGGYFSKNKWVIIADDDTYIFHYNMMTYLDSLDAHSPVYTGHTIDDGAYPVNGDGDGHVLNVSVTEHFACGGGGSVFSHAAIVELGKNMDGCIKESMPGGQWWGWQSDWMFGACAARSGVQLLNQNHNDRFGQFIFVPDDPAHSLALPDEPGVKQFCEHHGGTCKEPVSVHPVHEPAGMIDLYQKLPDAAKRPITDAKILLKQNGRISVNGH